MGSGEGRGEAPLGDRPLQHPATQSFGLHHPHGPRSFIVAASRLWPFTAFPLQPLVPPSRGPLALHTHLSPVFIPSQSPRPGFRQPPGTSSAPHSLPGPWFHALPRRWSLMALSPTTPWSPIGTDPQPSSHCSPQCPEPHNPHCSLAQLSPQPSQSLLLTAPDAAQPQPLMLPGWARPGSALPPLTHTAQFLCGCPPFQPSAGQGA